MAERTPKILVVDDDPRLRDLLRRYLGERLGNEFIPDARFAERFEEWLAGLGPERSRLPVGNAFWQGRGEELDWEEPAVRWQLPEPLRPAWRSAIRSAAIMNGLDTRARLMMTGWSGTAPCIRIKTVRHISYMTVT